MMSDQKYHCKIYGFGEKYEQVSVNRVLKQITVKYGKPMKVIVFSKCGIDNIRRSEELARKYKGQFLEFVACDNPLWECYFQYGGYPVDKYRNKFLLELSKIIFLFLCPIFEYNRDPNLAHCKIGVLKNEKRF